ncbi:speedy protein A-like [Oppia nitens]|uniref:speedy protein A-like n=1 Tax=Oppia nitens TaxID=1686743 RepID=UPI0023DBF571|nr:speedy protein A-like [Oppia nitens]
MSQVMINRLVTDYGIVIDTNNNNNNTNTSNEWSQQSSEPHSHCHQQHQQQLLTNSYSYWSTIGPQLIHNTTSHTCNYSHNQNNNNNPNSYSAQQLLLSAAAVSSSSSLSSGRPSSLATSSPSVAANNNSSVVPMVGDYQDFALTKKDIYTFKRLLEEPLVEELLLWDKCCLLADKYLLAMALTYFKRAGLRHQQFTPVYLMVALYLAHDMEEDDLDMKLDLVRFAMSDTVTESKHRLFLRKRDKLWHQMNFRAAVNHVCCDAIMKYCLPDHKIWRRERSISHGGVCLPPHVKTVVHKEMHLVNSYVECNVQCIVCLSHAVMRRKRQASVQSAASTMTTVAASESHNNCVHQLVVKSKLMSTLSAFSAPFVPQNYYYTQTIHSGPEE